MEDHWQPSQLSSAFLAADPLELACIDQVNLDAATGPFSGQDIGRCLHCTGTEGQTCQIAQNLSTWNEFLCHGGLEIRYLPERNGQLCLFTFSAIPPVKRHRPEVTLRQVAALVRLLLKTHCCVTSVCANLNELNVPEEVLFDALQDNVYLKKLVLDTTYGDMSEDACAAISTLTALEEFECRVPECSPEFSSALSTLLRTAPLTALRIPELQMDQSSRNELLSALRGNTTVKEISLDGSVLGEACGVTFTECVRNSATLTTLSVKADPDQEDQGFLNDLLRALLENKTIATFTLRGFRFGPESAILLEKIISENDAIRALHIIDTPRTACCQDGSSYDSWLAALAGNDRLEELTLPLHIWTAEMWERFFTILAGRANLRIVTIQKEHYSDLGDCKRVFKALKESGQQEKVSLKTCRVLDYFEPLECGLTLEEPTFKHRLTDITLFGTMPSADHVTSLSLEVTRGDQAVSSALANYLRTASALQFLSITVESEDEIVSAPNAWWTVILEPLSRNETIKTLRFVAGTLMDVHELESLADVVIVSRSIRGVAIFSDSCTVTRRLADGIRDNRTLMSATLCDDSFVDAPECWFAVRDTARRNSDLLTRAALFVNGFRFDRYGSAAYSTC
ncbi:hypothetical protein V5799_012751 [Amblyomma americanum]|uniref:Uncharacterized protein n=1 Tax=Amblyomma americanum TaxID=6943 RepID=A0AAQ4E7W9_AMBAM